MEFYEVLDRVIDLLRQRGRVTYNALKRQFAVDDDFLEDLKNEIFYAYPVIDDDGRGLVWTGQAEEKPAIASQPDQATRPRYPRSSTPHSGRTAPYCNAYSRSRTPPTDGDVLRPG
jgi:hypothetical protein